MFKLAKKITKHLSVETLSFAALFFFIHYSSTAQKVFSAYPFQYDLVAYQLNVLNPAIQTKNERFIQAGYNGFNQLSSSLASYYLNVRYAIGKDSNYKKHIVGVFLTYDKEGEYLGRLRGIGQYGYKIYFSDNTSLTSGLSLGFINNALKPNNVTGGESVYATEVDVGLCLNHKENLMVGVSLNQIVNNPVRFFNGSYPRIRYFSVVTGYAIPISFSTKVKTMLFYRTGSDLFNKYAAQLSLVYKELFTAGMALKSANGIAPLIGVQNIPVGSSRFGFLFSFRFPTSRLVKSGTGNAELMVEYKF